MAWSTVETKIANPARKRAGGKKRRNVAKKLSAKQIKFFGTKRQRAALKAKRRKPAKKRHTTARKRTNPTRRVRRRTVAVRRTRAKSSAPRRRTRRRSNPGEIVSLLLGNPSTKRRKAVAKRRKK